MKATSIEPLGATCTREVCTKSQNLLHKHHYENEWSLDQKTSLRVCLREKSILHCKKGKKHHPHPFSLPLLWNVSLRPWEKGRHPWDQQDTGKGPLQLREGGKKKKNLSLREGRRTHPGSGVVEIPYSWESGRKLSPEDPPKVQDNERTPIMWGCDHLESIIPETPGHGTCLNLGQKKDNRKLPAASASPRGLASIKLKQSVIRGGDKSIERNPL